MKNKIIIITLILSTLVFSTPLVLAEDVEEEDGEKSRLRAFEEEMKEEDNEYDSNSLRYFLNELLINTIFSSDAWNIRWVINTTTYPYRAPYYRLERSYIYRGPSNRNYNYLDTNKESSMDILFARQYVDDNIKGTRVQSKIVVDRVALEMAYTEYEDYSLDSINEYLSFKEGILTYSFARNDKWDFRSGLGLKSISGMAKETRFKYLYGIEYTDSPIKLGLDLGFAVSQRNTVGEFFPSISYYNHNLQLRGGYRRYKVVNQSISGPELALKFKF